MARRGRPHLLVVLLAFFLGSVPSPARAQVLERFALHAELGGGGMFSTAQRDRAHEDVAVTGAARVAVRLFDPLAIAVSYESWFFPNGGGQAHDVFGGLRVEPKIAEVGRIWLDANLGLTITGPLSPRLGLSIGFGFDFQVLPWLAVGPYLRYGHVFATGSDYPSDASYLAGGAAVTLAVPEVRHPSEVDSDHDGVADGHDVCPGEAAGTHPDPARVGCPLTDRDSDGVEDRSDVCPDQPAGATPDATRRGCPAVDSDGDGVLDPDDACPSTSAGAHPDPSHPGCPDPDRDSDGVPDHSDQCPSETPGLHPDRMRPGCPEPDEDQDSVPDASDACPHEAGSPSPDARRNGCPGLVHVERSEIRIDRPVFFATRRDRVLPSSTPVLQAVADALIATPEILRVSIDGHTDDVGEDAANQDLSERRAANVMAWLIAVGISPSRLESHGHGESAPLVPTSTDDARSVNRRVEFRILDTGTPPPATPPTPPTAPEPPAPPAPAHGHHAHGGH